MTDQRAYWIQLGEGNTVIGGGAVQGAEAIAVTLAKPGRVQVTADVAAQLRQGGAWVWDGSALVAAPPAGMTADDRARAILEADHMAEAQRRPHLSAGAGQALEYVLTLEEARAYLAASVPVAADFPLLGAELAALAACGQPSTLAAVAQAVVEADRATRVHLAAIKTKRRIAKITIRSATDHNAIDASLAAMKAPI